MGPLRSMDSTASATDSTERSTRVDAHTVHHGTSDMEAVREEGEGWSRAFLLEHDSMDLVIMNSAFTRPTNHEARKPPCPRSEGSGGGRRTGRMSRLLRRMRSSIKNPAAHGNAWLASSFLDVGHAKVRPSGITGLYTHAENIAQRRGNVG